MEKGGLGATSSNYAGVKGKDIVIVDDVVGTGETMTSAVKGLKKAGAKPKLIITIVNKAGMSEIDGVPVRSLVSARSLSE